MIRFLLTFFMVLGISAIIPMTNSGAEEGFTFLETDVQGGSTEDSNIELYSYFALVLLACLIFMTIAF